MFCILKLDDVLFLFCFFRQDTDYYNISHFRLEQYMSVIVRLGGINACARIMEREYHVSR